MSYYNTDYLRRSSDWMPSRHQREALNTQVLSHGLCFFHMAVPDGYEVEDDFVTQSPHLPDQDQGSLHITIRGPDAGHWKDDAFPFEEAHGNNVLTWWSYLHGVARIKAYCDMQVLLDRLTDYNGKDSEDQS